MSIFFQCPACSSSIRVPEHHAGKRARCTKCSTELRIPPLAPQAGTSPPLEHPVADTGIRDQESPTATATRQASEGVPTPPLGLRTRDTQAPRGATGQANIQDDSAAQRTVTDYTNLPWYRKSGIMSVLTGASIFTWCVPMVGAVPILIVCIALAAGDIYYRRQDHDGGLRKWHRANRWAAFGILGLNGVYLLYWLLWLIRGTGSAQ